LKLNHLVDLEWQLMQDAELEPSEIEKRDRVHGNSILRALELEATEAWEKVRSPSPDFRRQLCLAWIDRLRSESGGDLPGRRVERGDKYTFWILAAIVAVAGASTASGTVSMSPVNVTWFLAIFVLLQVVLIGITVFMFAVTRGGVGAGRYFRSLSSLPLMDRLTGIENRRQLESLESKAGTHELLYGRLERWSLFTLSQNLACIFLFSALFAFLCLVSFTHLTFSWLTTLDLQPESVHQLVKFLGAPFAWLFPDSVPDAELIEGSHNVIGKGVRTERWWQFLALTLVTWSLLPRLALWVFGVFQKQRASRDLDCSSRAFLRLYDRLLPGPSWQSPAIDRALSPDKAGPRIGRTDIDAAKTENKAAAIAWRLHDPNRETLMDFAEQLMQRPISKFLSAGGANVQHDQQVLNQVETLHPTAVCIVSEGQDSPTKDLLRFVESLRAKLNPTDPIALLLFDIDQQGTPMPCVDEDLDAWRHFVERTSDPYVRVETLT